MSLTLTINQEDYPEIFNLYKKDRIKKVESIFKTGYNIYYPELNKIQDNILSNNSLSNNSMNLQVTDLIHKLTGINNNSSKRGEFGESMLEDIITKRYGDIIFENKSKVPHCGDAWIYLPNKKIIMLESKNYTYRVNKDEVDKMESDMKTNYIKFGIFVSWSSQVQNRKELDFHTFCHNGETYMIIIVSNLGNDIIKLDLSLQIIRELVENFNDIKQFQWIQNDITQSLNELDIIIQKNYLLKDNYNIMSNNIRNSMDEFYNQLQNYQYQITIKAQEIIDKVKNTMNNSKDKNKITQIPNIELLKEFKKNKKMFPILCCLLDTILNIDNMIVNSTTDINIFNIFKNNEEIGFFKIKNKKVSLCFSKINYNIELECDKYNESIKIIPYICQNI